MHAAFLSPLVVTRADVPRFSIAAEHSRTIPTGPLYARHNARFGLVFDMGEAVLHGPAHTKCRLYGQIISIENGPSTNAREAASRSPTTSELAVPTSWTTVKNACEMSGGSVAL